MYEYKAKVLKVLDGDTVKVSLRLKRTTIGQRLKLKLGMDLGCHVFIEDGWICLHENLRLFGVNANEKNTPAGVAAKTWLKEQLPADLVVTVQTIKDKTEKYGRFLALIKRPGDSMLINERLVLEGH